MNTSRLPEFYIGFLFLVLPFFYIEITQDPEITLRFLAITSFTTLFATFILLRYKKALDVIEINPLIMAFGAYLIYSLLTITKSINSGDAIFEAGKTGIWLITLILLSSQIKKSLSQKFTLPFVITLSVLIFIIAGIYQYINIPLNEKITKQNIHVFSFLSSKNFFAETLLLSFPFTLLLLASESKLHKLLSLVTIALILPFIFYIQSLTVITALILFFLGIGLLVFFFRKIILIRQISKKEKLFVSIFTIFILALPIVLLLSDKINTHGFNTKIEAAKNYITNPGEIFKTNSGVNDNSLYERAFLIKNSIHIFMENPLTGAGLANWEILLPKYGLYGNKFMSVGRVRYEHPHNDYLFIVCETGIIGLILWLAIFGFGIYYAFRTIKLSENKFTKLLMIMMIGNLISFGVISLFSYPKERFFSMLLLILTLSIITANNLTKTKTIKLPANAFLVAIILLCSILTFINLIRYRSEVSLFKAFQFQKKELFSQMQKYTESAISPFHSLDQTGTPLNWHLGQSYYYQNNQQKAFENYLIASEQNPYHMQVLNDLGAMFESQGNHAKAIECFNRVFAINPNFADSKFNLVAVYFNSGETEKAYRLLNDLEGKHSQKWKTSMQTILFSKTEKIVRQNQDTLLVEIINQHIKTRPMFLLEVYYEANKSGITFEEQLQLLKVE